MNSLILSFESRSAQLPREDETQVIANEAPFMGLEPMTLGLTVPRSTN